MTFVSFQQAELFSLKGSTFTRETVFLSIGAVKYYISYRCTMQ